MRNEMQRAADNMRVTGSGEVLRVRQDADVEVTAARSQTRYYEQEVQELRDELHARSSSSPDASSYTRLVCELDQARTEVKDRQQHIGDLNIMLRLSEEQLERERKGEDGKVSIAEHHSKIKEFADEAQKALSEVTNQAASSMSRLQQEKE